MVVAFGLLVWHRRWMSDDGLIVLRTVRNLLGGAGPVFNAGERVEANTSTLWTYLLALPGLVPGVSLNWAAVVLGLLLAAAGLGFAIDGARRLWRARTILPAGALVVLVLPPFWDFGTSGLETGLTTGWLGLLWWLLVRTLRREGSAWPLAVVLGLAPIVRPDLALVGVAAAVALVVLEWRGGLLRLLGLAGAAATLPALYEVFRMGYYGLLVPSTALAKEAGDPRWEQGLHYLDDLASTYELGIAGAALLSAAVLVGVAQRRPPAIRTAVVVAAPLVSAALLTLYVVRVGGDFMHARMLLPALFCLILPVAAVPLSAWSVVPVLGLAAWSAVCLVGLRPAYDTMGPYGIANERLYYSVLLDVPNPITVEDYRRHPMVPEGVAELTARDAGPTLAIAGVGERGLQWWLYSAPATDRDTLAWLNLGVAGELAPLDTRVLDGVGLVNPIAGHATGVPGGRIGHDKDLLPEWFLADAGVTGDTGFVDPTKVAAAREALACPETVEVIESYRAPLTLDRFWQNLTGSLDRTGYRYPRDAEAAATCD
jgi:arabinofuranosyltransferase